MNYQVIVVNDKIRNKNYYYSYVINDQASNVGVFSVDDTTDTITVSDLPPYQDINKANSCYWDSENAVWVFDDEKYAEILKELKESESDYLESYKKEKICKSKKDLEAYLETHPLTSTAHGGVEGIYSVTLEKQNLMMSQYMTYQIEKNINPNAKLTWNECGKVCEEWSEEEFLKLALEVKNYIKPIIESQQRYEVTINNATTKDEIENIIFDLLES